MLYAQTYSVHRERKKHIKQRKPLKNSRSKKLPKLYGSGLERLKNSGLGVKFSPLLMRETEKQADRQLHTGPSAW
jgi:hypothetical protein